MKHLLTILLLTSIFYAAMSQTPNPKDYYYQIPDYPADFSATNTVARMVDGLGFRFYWATESLRPEDLAYKPSSDARTSQETLDHIYGMSAWVLGAVNVDFEQPQNSDSMSFSEKRTATLINYEMTSKALLAMTDEALSEIKIPAGRGQELPFWNHINGPISDALWHVGQVVSFRRASGNPFTSNVSMFTGKVRD